MMRARSMMAGMTDYTGVSAAVILSQLGDWRRATAETIEALHKLAQKAEESEDRLNYPSEISSYVEYFIDLLGRYLDDLDRLLAEIPKGVTEAHIHIVQQIYDSASHEERSCVRFKQDHIECALKDESMRPLVDHIYQETRGMLIDYKDLSNLIPRLKTFVGTAPRLEKELEQKFGILCSPTQEQRDFDSWLTDGRSVLGYTIGVVFFDIDNFKSLNSALTESVVDQVILRPIQEVIRNLSIHRCGAYRHGGEEFLLIFPNCTLDETAAFAEKLRVHIEAKEFPIDGDRTQRVTVSIGVATWPTHGKTLEEVIKAANEAEHRAKACGRNRVEVAPATGRSLAISRN